MKFIALLLFAGSVAHAGTTEIRDVATLRQLVGVYFTGEAAEEMYAALNVRETEVRDEHGGVARKVKYGSKIGCEIEDSRTTCWIKQ